MAGPEREGCHLEVASSGLHHHCAADVDCPWGSVVPGSGQVPWKGVLFHCLDRRSESVFGRAWDYYWWEHEMWRVPR